ncbi:MAG: hypothetical protein ABIP75_00185 [Pyrinomonadaceae bacterium]
MSELDEAWNLAIAEAERRARAGGRGDVAEYLALRAANDLARQTAIDWLGATFLAGAGEANRRGAAITLERTENHRFTVNGGSMVGVRVTLRSGVRSLTVEAGWPRTPRDGFVVGNGLACGRIGHFGNRKANDELLLVRPGNGAPEWWVVDQDGTRRQFRETRVGGHLIKLVGID